MILSTVSYLLLLFFFKLYSDKIDKYHAYGIGHEYLIYVTFWNNYYNKVS